MAFILFRALELTAFLLPAFLPCIEQRIALLCVYFIAHIYNMHIRYAGLKRKMCQHFAYSEDTIYVFENNTSVVDGILQT